MVFFRCDGCSQPLSPPVYQCFCGHPHFICSSCNGKHPQRKCSMCTCSKSRFKPCPSMDKLLSEIVVPGKRGCAGSLAYDRCPGSGCGFGGESVELLDHYATHHKWPMTGITYGEEFDVPANPGLHVLRGGDDGQLFVLNVAGL